MAQADELFQVNEEQYGAKYRDHLLDQYKLFVESADRVSQRRMSANNYLLTVNTFLITLYGLVSQFGANKTWQVVVPLAGVLVCTVWYALIRSYQILNRAKFEVINKLEARLPAALFECEWELAMRDKKQTYVQLSFLERFVPIIFGLLYLVLGGVSLFGASNTNANPERPKYEIGLGPWMGFGPFYLAQENGYFEEAGLDVELTVLTGIAERNSALRSGNIDALAAPVDYFVLSAGNGLETKIVMAVDESTGGDGIVARKEIQSIEELRGTRVALQRGLPAEFFFRALLRDHNMTIEDVETVDMETAQAGAAFLAGQVDAAVVWEPWLTKAKEEGGGHVLASTAEYPDLIVDCLAFNTDVVQRSPHDVQKIVNALFRAIEYWHAHPAEANAIMAPHFDISAEKYATILQGLKFCDRVRNKAYFGTPSDPGPIFHVAGRASDIWLEAKVIKRPVIADAIISTDFVNK